MYVQGIARGKLNSIRHTNVYFFNFHKKNCSEKVSAMFATVATPLPKLQQDKRDTVQLRRLNAGIALSHEDKKEKTRNVAIPQKLIREHTLNSLTQHEENRETKTQFTPVSSDKLKERRVLTGRGTRTTKRKNQ